jgi:hypothetical protein
MRQSIARRRNSNIFNKNQLIPAIHLWRRLQLLVKYPQDTLVAEIQRLALFAPESLRKELEPMPDAPIHRLPDDILSDIFLLGLHDAHAVDEDFEKPQRYQPQYYQGLISLVCHRWKAVMEGTPLVWANITVLERQPFTTTKRFLRLSRTCLINIAVKWRGFPIEDGHITLNAYNINDMKCLFGLLSPEAHRWRNLLVAVEDYSLIHYVVQELQWASAPNLRMLCLGHHDDEAQDRALTEMTAKYKLFQSPTGAPLLRDVTLWGAHIDWSSTFLSSNLRQLALCYHHIHLRPEPRRFFEILSSCSETLEEFTLESSGPILEAVDWDLCGSSKIELPKLHMLKLASLSAEYAQRILDIIVARNVEELTLDFEDSEMHIRIWNALVKKLCTGGISSNEPIFPSLTSLRLLSLPVETIHLGALLYYHPRITSLVINFNYVNDYLPDMLGMPLPKIGALFSLLPEWATTLHSQVAEWRDKSRTGGQTVDENVRRKEWLCPELRKLKVYGVDSIDLRLLVAGRKEGGVPLKEVWYADTCTLKMSDRAWLKANLEVFEEFEDNEGKDDEDEDDEDEEDEDEDEDYGDYDDYDDYDDEDDEDEDDEDDEDDEEDWI